MGRDDHSLADALRVVAASARAGATVQQALHRASQRTSGVVATAFGEAAARIALGRPVDVELERLATVIDTPPARLFSQVVRVQHRRGGELGGACHRLAALLHERIRLDAEARAATAQARFSARAVVAIPVVLVVAAAWRAPDSVRALLRPDAILLAMPGVVGIAVGALVARRIARSACTIGDIGRRRDAPGRVGRAARRIAGNGPRSLQSARLLLATSLPVLVSALTARSPATVACATVSLLVAAAWPWTDAARTRRRHAAIAQSGIETLLEVSIALFAAGATAHEVATLAPASTDEPLRAALAPAVHRVGMGRSIAASFEPVPELAASPQLDGWLHAICTSSELGAPATDVLEQLLRDARAIRREQLRTVAQTAAPRMQLALVLLVVPGVMWLMLLATFGGLVQQLRASGVV